MNPRIIEKTTIIKDLLPSATSTTNAKPFIVRIPQLQTKSPHPLDTNKVFIVKTNPLATPTATPNVTSTNVSLAAPTQSGAKFSVVKLADGQLVLVPTAATPTTTTTTMTMTTPTTQPLVINENSISRIIKASSTSPPNPTGVISTIKRVTKEPTTPRISTIQIKNLSSSATNFKSPSAQERRLRAIAPAPSALATATSELFNSFFQQQQQQLNAASAENLLRFDPTASVLLGEEDSLPVISETITVDSNGSSLKNLSNHKRKLDSLPIEQKTSLPVVASVSSMPVEPPPPPPAPPKPKTPVRKTSNHEEKPITKTKTTSAANKETTKKITTKQSNTTSNSITPTFRPSAEHKKAVVPTTTTPKIDPEEGIRMKICETILRSLIGKIEREQNQESIKTRLEKHSTTVPKHEHRQIILTRLLNERVDHLRQEFLKNRQERKTALVKEQFEIQRQKQQEFIFKQQQQQHQQQSSSTNRSELNLSDDDDDDDDDDEDETQQLQRSVSPPTKKLKRPTIKIKSLPAKRTRPTDDETPMKKIRRQRQPSDNDENLHRRSSGKNKSKLFSTVNQIIQRKGNKFSADFHPSNLDCRCRRNDDLQEKFFVQCELCSRWLHGKCAGLTPRLAEKISEFICEECSCLTERAKERLYCICQTPYDDSKFYIGCDVCADWLHGSCVNITPDDADKFEVYVCPRCSTEKKQEFLNKPITGDTRKKLLNLIDQLLSHKMSWPFQKPVDVKDVPNYYKIIKDPMDLTTLKSKVLSHKFKTICDFIRDVNKIFNNCRQFNAIDSTFAQCANVVDNYFRQLLENLMVRDH